MKLTTCISVLTCAQHLFLHLIEELELHYVKFVAVLLATGSCFFGYDAAAQQTSLQTSDQTQSQRLQKKQMRKANWALQSAVRKQILKQSVDLSNIFVRACAGFVTLTGSVPDASQISAAGNAAQSVPGVNSVANWLTLRYPGR
jgi:hyperosmotically inducible protein